VSSDINREGDRGFVSSEMAETGGFVRKRSHAPVKNVESLAVTGSVCTMGILKQKVTMEIPVCSSWSELAVLAAVWCPEL